MCLFSYVKKFHKYFGQIILGLVSRKSLATCPTVSYSIHCRCRNKEPKYWIRLAYPVGTVDAYYQSHCYRLYPQMAIAAYLPTYQHLFGKVVTIIVIALAVAFYKTPYPISIETNS